jgi:SAM-dependent methyltransferase
VISDGVNQEMKEIENPGCQRAPMPQSDSQLSPVQASIFAASLGEEVIDVDGCLSVGSRSWPIKGGVVRFRCEDGYNSSFAKQWKAFQLTQYDDHNKTSITRARYLKETGWTDSGLAGELVLEAGCGAGRFTRLLAATGAWLLSFDYSSAVEVSREQNGHFPNVAFAQADILAMPFAKNSFDRVFCHGVIQHTPDPAAAFRNLNRVLRSGGRLTFDVYHRDGRIRPWKSKYIWRPITTRMDPDRLMAFLEWFIPKWLPLDTLIKRIPILGNYLGAVIPCWNYFYTDLPAADQVRWGVMDTFDALAPAYAICPSVVTKWWPGSRRRATLISKYMKEGPDLSETVSSPEGRSKNGQPANRQSCSRPHLVCIASNSA